MEHIGEYSLDARAIIDGFDSRLIQFYNTRVVDTELDSAIYDIMASWYLVEERAYSGNVSLFDLTCYILEVSMLRFNDTKTAYDGFYESKRSRKRYLWELVEGEYTGNVSVRNPMFLQNYADAYFSLMYRNPQLKEYSNKKDLIDEQYKSVKDWRYSKDAYIFEFPFFDKLELKRQALAIEADVGYEIFSVIIADFHGKLGNYAVQFPSSLLNGVFTLNNEKLNIEITIDKDGTAVSKAEPIVMQEEDAEVVFDMIVDRKKDDDYSLLSNEEQLALTEELRVNNGLITQAYSLSSRELVVLSQVYSAFDINVISQGELTFNGMDFCKKCLNRNNIKSRDVRAVLKSLKKLKSTEIRIETRKDGVLVGERFCSFFDDLDYGLSDGAQIAFISNKNEESNIDLDEIPDDVLMSKNWCISIAPSKYLKDTWHEHINAEIYSRQFNMISDNKVRTYMILLQNERLLRPDMEEQFFSYGFFRSKVRLSGRFSRIKIEVATQLKELKDMSVIVADYIEQENGITIKFLPFTELEKELYFNKRTSLIEG